jgi:asparagine N-glycosylation enzyme membrane subunit Stt3
MAAASGRLTLMATVFALVAIPATVGFSGVEVIGWKGVAGFADALGLTVVLSALGGLVTRFILRTEKGGLSG